MTLPRTDTQSRTVIGELGAWQRALRSRFPIITAHPELAYLDSAATAQKPQDVLDTVHTYLTTTNANAGRGTYPWANRTTTLVEQARDRVKRFLDDPAPERSAVHFTSGTTEGLRTIARDWLPGLLADGDEIVVPVADHEANIAPWLEAQRELARQGVHIRVRPMPYQRASGDYDHTSLAQLVGPRTRFVAASHVHHVYGGNMNIHRIRQAVGPDAVICLDAAQSVGHLPVSVADLDADFVVFSGHKAMALPGTGAVWARQARGPRFTPGGWSGTPNTVGIASLAAPWTGWTRPAPNGSSGGRSPWRPGSPTVCATSTRTRFSAARAAWPPTRPCSGARASSPSGTRPSTPETSASSSTATAS